MAFITGRIVYAVLFYVLLVILLVLAKPSIMFETDGSIKPFGVGEDKTMFSVGVFSIVLALVSYYVFCIVDMVFAKRAVYTGV
jgi:hypothetical protein